MRVSSSKVKRCFSTSSSTCCVGIRSHFQETIHCSNITPGRGFVDVVVLSPRRVRKHKLISIVSNVITCEMPFKLSLGLEPQRLKRAILFNKNKGPIVPIEMSISCKP